jgi:terminase large subunit-like protein
MTRCVVRMTIEDAEHYTEEQRQAIISSYPAHERKARVMGIPMLGSGRVFPIDEDELKVPAFTIPELWPQIGGLDFGWDHPTAAVKLAHDRDTDTIYVTASWGQRETTPVIAAAALKSWGDWLPWAWPHDGLQHDKGSGDQLASLYRDQGLELLPKRATFEDGGFGVEAGIAEMLDRMQTGRWKVFDHLEDWFGEFRLYHRKDGLIVKLNDDRISASRYAMMMRRYAETKKSNVSFNFSGGGSWLAS